MDVNWRPEWEREDPADMSVNRDGSITFAGPVGKVFLPDEYKEFMMYTDGVGTKDTGTWFLTRYNDGVRILELEYLSDFFSVNNRTWGYRENLYHDGYTVPEGYIHIGTAEGDKEYTSVLLSVRKGEPDYGKVFTWMETQDPWMEGDNTQGLGFVANRFTEFMNNLTDRKNL